MITVIPAVDLREGRCVRLRRGRVEDAKVYSEDPVAMARHWVAKGAKYLHVVDLDGAFRGRPVHVKTIADIVASVDIPVEAGGGLRTCKDVRRALECGLDRAIVGTCAAGEPALLEDMVGEFGARLAVGIDSRDGLVQVRGWVEGTKMKAVDLAVRADGTGVNTLICTDTAVDGMMEGTNVDIVAEMCRNVNCSVIASGGISSVEDVKALRDLHQQNLIGAIVGKALYEGTVGLGELMDVGSHGSD